MEVQGGRGGVRAGRGVRGGVGMNEVSDLPDFSATELARLVACREVSPVEVVEACLARFERYDAAINAVVTLNERALDDAGALERRLARGEEPGPLCGLPVGIKDVTPVAGLRTTFGSPLYKDHVPAEDALVVRRLRAAGAVILGKTNCPEFAAGGNTFNEVFGRTRNPWDPTKRAGRAKGLRLAYCPDIAGIGIDPDVERVCHEAAGGLERAGATVEVIRLDLSFARPAFLALRGLWFVSWMYRRLDQLDRFGANVAGNIRSGLGTTTRDLAAAEEVRGRLWHRCRELFEQFDHLLTPCMAVPPFPVEQNYPDAIAGKPMETYADWIAPTFVLSLTGLPVASVP